MNLNRRRHVLSESADEVDDEENSSDEFRESINLNQAWGYEKNKQYEFKKSGFTIEEMWKLESDLKKAEETARKQTAEKEKALEEKDKALKEKENAIQMLDFAFATFRHQVTCKTCKQIYYDPIDLPCSKTICKSHFDDFISNKCQFCNQEHQMSLKEIKPNQSLNEILKMSLYLNGEEKKIKLEIEKLLKENKSITEDLAEKAAQSEMLCYDHFANVESVIDLQREELKKRIDEICFELIDKVKLHAFKLQAELKTNASKKVLTIDEIKQIESDFEQKLRQVEFPKENLETLLHNLNLNSESLNGKLKEIQVISDKIKECSFLIKPVDLDNKIYGVLNL